MSDKKENTTDIITTASGGPRPQLIGPWLRPSANYAAMNGRPPMPVGMMRFSCAVTATANFPDMGTGEGNGKKAKRKPRARSVMWSPQSPSMNRPSSGAA